MLVSHRVSARIKHGSSTRAINVLNHWAISSTLDTDFEVIVRKASWPDRETVNCRQSNGGGWCCRNSGRCGSLSLDQYNKSFQEARQAEPWSSP